MDVYYEKNCFEGNGKIWSVVSQERLKISRVCSAVEDYRRERARVEEPNHLKRARAMPFRVSNGRKL